jgi:hypothetical protein
MHELYRMLGSEREADLEYEAARIDRAAKASPYNARRGRTRLANALVAFFTRLHSTRAGYEVKESK